MTSLPIEIKLIPLWFILLILSHLIPFFSSYENLLYLQCFFLVTVGIFHGAYDLHFACLTKKIKTKPQLTFFVTQYVLQATFFCLFWLQFPNLGLIIFFLVACLHFGFDWEVCDSKRYCIIFGYSILAISFFTHPDTTTNLMNTLLPTLSPKLINLITKFVPITFMIGLWICLSKRDMYSLITWGSFMILGSLFSPLTFFTIYFCGYHSLKHINQMRDRLCHVHNSDLVAFVIWAISLAVLLGTYITLHETIHIYPLMTYFIILAGLTVPHMWLHLTKSVKTA